jgi:hypothetical protein
LKTIEGNSRVLQISEEMPLMKFYELTEQVTGIPKKMTRFVIGAKAFSIKDKHYNVCGDLNFKPNATVY